MILRVPDYYMDFECIADKCNDSCCIGWEIDIDDESKAYYESIEGPFGERLKENMYVAEDGGCRFGLKEHGRCLFLNEKNLCDLYIELGEEALGEVCTEYPRFAVEFGNVRQKVLSLSCEVVGDMVFHREEPVEYVDFLQPGMLEMVEGDNPKVIEFVKAVMDKSLDILKDRKLSIRARMVKNLLFVQAAQDMINDENYKIRKLDKLVKNAQKEIGNVRPDMDLDWNLSLSSSSSSSERLPEYSFADFDERFITYDDMLPVSQEWLDTKEQLIETLTADSYNGLVSAFIHSDSYKEIDFEHLMVYFTFRYMMNAVYDFSVISYAKLATVFSLVIRDMDAVRYHVNGQQYTVDDRIDIARIFSKEVEHSEENFNLAKEELLFGGVYSMESILKQI